MTTFERLPPLIRCPNEIIEEIVRCVLPEDLENFASISRHIRSVSLRLLPDHRAQIRKYSTLSVNTGYSGPCGRLLKDVLVHPRTARYITRLKIDVPNGSVVEQHYPSVKEYSEADLDLFCAAANHSEFLTCPTPDKSCWRDLIIQENASLKEELILAILLPLLPNLTTLVLRWGFRYRQLQLDYSSTSVCKNSLYCMLGRVRQARTPTLTKLRNVELWCYSKHYIKAFCGLPSVKTVSAPFSYPYVTLCEDSKSLSQGFVTDLALRNSNIRPSDLCDILCGSLRSFAYSYEPSSSYEPSFSYEAFNASDLRKNLLAYTGHGLRKLLLFAPGQKKCFMGGLHRFKALQELCIDWNLLVPRKHAIIPALLLPASIEVLTIHEPPTGFTDKDCEELVGKLILSKQVHELSLLRELNFISSPKYPVWETFICKDHKALQAQCTEVGVTLSFAPLDVCYTVPVHIGQDFSQLESKQQRRDTSYQDWLNNSGLNSWRD